MIWFTSDTHFRHKNIIKYCERPFETLTDMDIAMIERWNALVSPKDTVYHLGDFMFVRGKSLAEDFLEALNGRKILIAGNHDCNKVRKAKGWAEVHQYLELKNPQHGYWLILSHYPLMSWNGEFRGSVHLHGHSHGRLPPKPNSKMMDVGVDSNDFKPWSLPEILSKFP